MKKCVQCSRFVSPWLEYCKGCRSSSAANSGLGQADMDVDSDDMSLPHLNTRYTSDDDESVMSDESMGNDCTGNHPAPEKLKQATDLDYCVKRCSDGSAPAAVSNCDPQDSLQRSQPEALEPDLDGMEGVTFVSVSDSESDDSNEFHVGEVDDNQHSLPLPRCANCRRSQPTDAAMTAPYTIRISLVDVGNATSRGRSSRKFYFLESVNGHIRHVQLCEECKTYLLSDKPDNSKFELIWPTFVWSILSQPELIGSAWLLVPETWRPWWMTAVSECHDMTPDYLCHVPALFTDVSSELEKDVLALQNLCWATDLMPREHSLVIPSVKCPAGCSEFKHRCNNLPLDIVWEECLGTHLGKLYTNKAARACTRFFRSDYLLADNILLNQQWKCRASIARSSAGVPQILCCRHHSVKTHHLMIHPCRNPNGPISTDKSGGASPVIAIPRTLQKAKPSAYSASFQMATMEGSFSGLDTMFLATNTGVMSNSSTLAWKQDVLTTAGRTDIRAHLRAMNAGVEGPTIASQLESSIPRYYPYIDELRQSFLGGSSYVSLEDAVQLQQCIDFSGPESATVAVPGPAHPPATLIIQFRGHWPKRLVWTHPSCSGIGCRPPSLPSYSRKPAYDLRISWILSAMLLQVSDIWNAVAAEEKRDSEWEGWLLTYLTRNYLTHVTPNGSRNSPFRKAQSIEVMSDKYITPQCPDKMKIKFLKDKFPHEGGRYPTLRTSWNRFTDGYADPIRIVVVMRDYCQENSAVPLDWEPSEMEGNRPEW